MSSDEVAPSKFNTKRERDRQRQEEKAKKIAMKLVQLLTNRDKVTKNLRSGKQILGSRTRAAVTEDMIICLLREGGFVLMLEPVLLELGGNMFVIGDIHGQFDDLLRIFEQRGAPPRKNYLFLGDYADRGTMGVECLALLFSLKILHPRHIYLLRGNHEHPAQNAVCGFEGECVFLVIFCILSLNLNLYEGELIVKTSQSLITKEL